MYFYPLRSGCRDKQALNFNPYATKDDGSCDYLETISKLLCADINQDNLINILDIMILINHILGTFNDGCRSLLDINQDKIVNIFDVLLLVNFVLEISSPKIDCMCK